MSLAVPDVIWPMTDYQEIYHQFQRTTDAYPLSSIVIQRLNHTIDLLQQWQAPAEATAGALFLPWIEHKSVGWTAVAPHLPPYIIEVVTIWHKLHQMTTAPTAGIHEPRSAYSFKLRCLMREAYLNPALVLLTVADHAARIALPDANNPWADDFWQETATIFSRLLHMLGMWELRREWVEQTAAHRHPEAFQKIQERLHRQHKHQQQCFANLQRHLSEYNQDNIPFTPYLREPSPGRIIYRNQAGESLDELCTCVTVTIITQTAADCYRLLDLVHRIGSPIQERLEDHIASTKANGYQALHTAVIGRNGSGVCRHKLLEFRIMSQSMDALNMWGIVKGKYQQPDQYPHTSAWWKEPDMNSPVMRLLQQYEVGQPAANPGERLYVFTPQGDVRDLVERSNALDFAYSLHSKIGHHCRNVYINGQQASHATQLQNGDLIYLEHDPYFPGPSPSWLHMTKNQRTRTKIMQGLGAARRAIHPGRQQIQQFLQAIAEESGLVVPEPQLEKYFILAAQELGLPDVGALFEAVSPTRNITGKQFRVAPERLLAYILESELVGAVVDESGQPIVALDKGRPTMKRPLLRFCPNCKPAPGAPLILHRKSVRSPRGYMTEHLTLHRQQQPQGEPKKRYYGLPDASRLLCVRDLEVESPHQLDTNVRWGMVTAERRAANFTVVAYDRSGLVGDLLEPAYQDDRITVNYIEATVDSESLANITFTMACDTMTQVEQLRQQMESVPDVVWASAWPASQLQSAHLKARYGGKMENPYTLTPVHTSRMLFGRETQIWELKSSLERSQPTPLLLIHGHRRSGKTSLAKMAHSHLPSVRFIYIDLEAVRGDLTPESIFRLMAQEVYNQLASSTPGHLLPEKYQLPPLSTWTRKNAYFIFLNYLEQIQAYVQPQRILLVLDEFNILVQRLKKKHWGIFKQFRALVNQPLDHVSLLLITHTQQYQQLPISHKAHLLYQQCVPIEVKALDHVTAERLVYEPVAHFLHYPHEIVRQMVAYTDGHPYLINLLCYQIVQTVTREGRAYVSLDDLQRAVDNLLNHGDNYFHFILDKITDQDHALVTAVATHQHHTHNWTLLSDVVRTGQLTNKSFRQSLDDLQNNGVLACRANKGHTEVRLIVDYFSQWVYYNWEAS